MVQGNAGSFASLRSEPSTIDAVSKEPTSASLPEAEDIFGTASCFPWFRNACHCSRWTSAGEANCLVLWTGVTSRDSSSTSRVHQLHVLFMLLDPLELLKSEDSVAAENQER